MLEDGINNAESSSTKKNKTTRLREVGVEEVLRDGYGGGKGTREFETRATDVQMGFERWANGSEEVQFSLASARFHILRADDLPHYRMLERRTRSQSFPSSHPSLRDAPFRRETHLQHEVSPLGSLGEIVWYARSTWTCRSWGRCPLEGGQEGRSRYEEGQDESRERGRVERGRGRVRDWMEEETDGFRGEDEEIDEGTERERRRRVPDRRRRRPRGLEEGQVDAGSSIVLHAKHLIANYSISTN